jgi:hypothetical protein
MCVHLGRPGQSLSSHAELGFRRLFLNPRGPVVVVTQKPSDDIFAFLLR